MTSPLYGRKLESDLVYELMRRQEDTGHPVADWQPVLVLEGGAATGKTALMDALAGGCAGRVPCAYLDLDLDHVEGELGDAAIPKLLAALAFQLTRRCKLYGSLRFDRLVIGLLTMQLQLNQVDPKQARSQVIEMLRNRRGLTTLRRILGDVAQDALRLVPGPIVPSSDIVTTIAELIVDRLTAWVPTRRRVLGRFSDWYGHQDRELGLDSIDELIRLNRSTGHHNRSGDRRDADELLWSAFHADLRDNFRTGRHAEEWSLNCLLLLDNADTPLGRDFLRRLVQMHKHPPVRGLDVRKDIQDPVTVVVTSRGGLLAGLTKIERAAVREVAVAEDVRLPAGGRNGGRISWLRRVLPALTVDEVQEMVRKAALSEGNTPNLATLLHQLGGGHPGGTMMLLTAVAGEHTTLVEPEELFRSDQTGIALEAELYDRLLAGVPKDAIDTVITCAAGRNRPEGLFLLNRGGVRDQADSALLPVGMWDPDSEVHTTLLRLLLLRQLARRPETHKQTWSAVHDRLRAASTKQGDPIGELYHALANERIDEVAWALTQRLSEDSLPDWLALLDAVTTAPRRPRDSSTAPEDGDQEDSRSADDTGESNDGADTEPLTFTRTLVTALWTVADPLCGTNRSALYWRIAVGYRDLSRHTNHQSEDLFELIQVYEQLSRRWRRGAHRPARSVRGRT